MKRAVYFIIAILLINFTSCRKRNTTPQPTGNDTTHHDTISNSTFTDCYLLFYRWKNVIRDSTGSISNDYYSHAGATMWGSSAFPPVKSILLNGNLLQGPDLDLLFGTLYYWGWGYTDTARWKIISRNNVADMELSLTPLPIYSDSIPYNISRSANLTIPLNALQYPDADSVRISVNQSINRIDTILHGISGSVTFSSAKLSLIPYNGSGILNVSIFKHSTVTINNRNYVIVNGTYTGYYINLIP